VAAVGDFSHCVSLLVVSPPSDPVILTKPADPSSGGLGSIRHFYPTLRWRRMDSNRRSRRWEIRALRHDAVFCGGRNYPEPPFAKGDRQFESCSLQRRVCKPSVPQRRSLSLRTAQMPPRRKRSLSRPSRERLNMAFKFGKTGRESKSGCIKARYSSAEFAHPHPGKPGRPPLRIELLCDRSNRRRLVPNALSLPPFGFAMQQDRIICALSPINFAHKR